MNFFFFRSFSAAQLAAELAAELAAQPASQPTAQLAAPQELRRLLSPHARHDLRAPQLAARLAREKQLAHVARCSSERARKEGRTDRILRVPGQVRGREDEPLLRRGAAPQLQ